MCGGKAGKVATAGETFMAKMKNTMRKLTAMLAAVALTVGLCPAGAFAVAGGGTLIPR